MKRMFKNLRLKLVKMKNPNYSSGTNTIESEYSFFNNWSQNPLSYTF